MPIRILIVEDEAPLATMLAYNLEAEGFIVQSVDRGDEAEQVLKDGILPDIVLLDWMIPGVSGIELCRRLRSTPATAKLPIIMLTARGEESERIRGLTTGADDYIVKPFSIPELMARIKSLLRRTKPELMDAVLRIGALQLDKETHRVHYGDTEIHLGPTEFRLLEFFMKTPGRVYAREQLLNGVWGHDVYVDERTVDVHVGRLRKALTANGTQDPIRTVRGAGYAFDERFGR